MMVVSPSRGDAVSAAFSSMPGGYPPHSTTGGCWPLSMGEGTLPPQRNAHFGSSRRRGGSVADPPGCLLGTLEAHLGARDPLEGGDPSGGWGTPQGGW